MHNRHNKNSKNSEHVLSLVDSRELFLKVVLVVGMVVIVAQVVGGGGNFLLFPLGLVILDIWELYDCNIACSSNLNYVGQ